MDRKKQGQFYQVLAVFLGNVSTLVSLKDSKQQQQQQQLKQFSVLKRQLFWFIND